MWFRRAIGILIVAVFAFMAIAAVVFKLPLEATQFTIAAIVGAALIAPLWYGP